MTTRGQLVNTLRMTLANAFAGDQGGFILTADDLAALHTEVDSVFEAYAFEIAAPATAAPCVDLFDRRRVLRALTTADGDKELAAARLRLSVEQLDAEITRLGIEETVRARV